MHLFYMLLQFTTSHLSQALHDAKLVRGLIVQDAHISQDAPAKRVDLVTYRFASRMRSSQPEDQPVLDS